MALSKQVAVRNRRRLLENGEDKMDSADEDDEKKKPDVLEEMYASGTDPEKGPPKLTQAQVAHQKGVAVARKSQMILTVPRVESPDPEEIFESAEPPRIDLLKSGGSSDDDTLDRPEYIWSVSKGISRRNKAWVRRLADSALALPAPEPDRQPTPMSCDTNDQAGMTEDQKRCSPLGMKKAGAGKTAARSRAVADPAPPSRAAVSQRAPAGSHPMSTRLSDGSRAGGFRGVVGSGITGYVRCLLQPFPKPGS
jgi:hypothetical protein